MPTYRVAAATADQTLFPYDVGCLYYSTCLSFSEAGTSEVTTERAVRNSSGSSPRTLQHLAHRAEVRRRTAQRWIKAPGWSGTSRIHRRLLVLVDER
jgi:hypothetical protein